MLKKIVSLVVGATLVLATLGVSAAVNTTSTYDYDARTIAVETEVTEVEAGQVYTYLAYKQAEGASLENLQNSEVVYVDEKVVGESDASLKFNYTTTIDKEGALVRLGAPVGNDVLDGGIIEEGKVYRYYTVAVGNGAASAVQSIEVKGDETADQLVDIPVALESGLVAGVSVNGSPVATYIATNEGVKIPWSALVAEGESAIVISTEAAAIETSVTIIDGGFADADQEANGGEAVIVLAEIEGNADEYGIAFGPAYTGAYDYLKAYAKGSDGTYAIKLVNFEDTNMVNGGSLYYDEENNCMWAKAYAKVGSETIESENAIRIDLTVEAAE